MTQEEWQALIEILNRVPLTQAERFWVQALIQREMAKFIKDKEEEQKNDS